MTNPDIPKQPPSDAEKELEVEARRRRMGYLSNNLLGFPMPRRIIDGPRASHYESDYVPTKIEPSD